MIRLYEIDYKFLDEIGEPDWRNGQVVAYRTGTPAGDTMAHALECAEEDGDFTGVDKLLMKMLSVRDDDVAFYYDVADIENDGTPLYTKLGVELQKNFGIIINDIRKVAEWRDS
jgi:hypothetical protein